MMKSELTSIQGKNGWIKIGSHVEWDDGYGEHEGAVIGIERSTLTTIDRKPIHNLIVETPNGKRYPDRNDCSLCKD